MSATSKRPIERLDGPDADQKVKTEPAAPRSELEEPPERESLYDRGDWSFYLSLATLPQKAGVPAEDLPRLVAKEFTDNALDSADKTDRPGDVSLVLLGGNLTIIDQGTGIPVATPERIADLFSVSRGMVSSKLLRRPTRGCVGNGLRVCLGYLAATGGRLIVETGTLRVELRPDEIDGVSHIIQSETIEELRGVTLTAVASKTPFIEDHLTWARNAIELARQSSEPAFTGRPSLHWFDLDHFRVLLRTNRDKPSVRQFLAQFDGCQGSVAQSRIAAKYLRRSADSLDAGEAAELLAAGQRATKPPKASALRPLGKDAVISGGYAKVEGSFTTGQNAPRAEIKFLVECWADAFFPDEQEYPLRCMLYMNRTRASASATGQMTYDGQLRLSVSGASFWVDVANGPHYGVTLNITSPMFLLTSDGKTPDCKVFQTALGDAIGKAMRQAGRDVAAQMTAEQKQAASHQQRLQREEEQNERLANREAQQQRLAVIADEKAQRKALPSIRDAVLGLLPGAVEIESAPGLYFNTRRLIYRIRDEVLERTGKVLKQAYFDDLLTELEAKHGDLHPLLIRAARGHFSIPHAGGVSWPLGSREVADFVLPPWRINKIVSIEKDDLRFMLRQAGWDARNDAMLTSSIGFDNRAAKDLIDKSIAMGEPLQPFSVHDADAAGTGIHHSLQHATPARGGRQCVVIDLGLQPWEGFELGLSHETAPPSYHKKTGKLIRKSVGEYIRARTDRAPTGETWEEWLQHSRFELNAFTSPELIDWLDRKMVEHGAGKLIPPDDILIDGFRERIRDRAGQAVAAHLDQRLAAKVATIETEQADATKDIRTEIDRITADLRAQLALVSEPFHQRIAEATAEYQAIDSEAMVDRVIKRATPEAEELREAISDGFSNDWVALPWAAVLHDIADKAEVVDVGAAEEAAP